MTSPAWHDPNGDPRGPAGPAPAAPSDGADGRLGSAGSERSGGQDRFGGADVVGGKDGVGGQDGTGGQVGGFAAAMGWAVPGVTGLGPRSFDQDPPSGQDPSRAQDKDLLAESGCGRSAREVLHAPVRGSVTDLVASVDAVLADGRPGEAGADSPSAQAEIAVLAVQLNRVQAALLDRLASVDAAGSWATDGSPSLRAWLAARSHSTLEAAGAQLRLARSLRSKALLAGALRTGSIRPEHAHQATRAMDTLAEQLPDQPPAQDQDDPADPGGGKDPTGSDAWTDPQQVLDQVEPALLTLAQLLDPRAFGVEVRRRTAALAPIPHHQDTAELDKARRLHLRQDHDGGWSGTFRYGPEDGALLETARTAWRATDHTAGDDRTPAQRDADALTGLVRRATDTGLPVQHGIRPHLIVLTPYDTWTAANTHPGKNSTTPNGTSTDRARSDEAHSDGARSGGASGEATSGSRRGAGATAADPLGLARAAGLQPATTLGGEPLPLPALRRLGCDARVTRIVLSPDGQPLDVGRTTRTISPAIWLAALARDRGCAIRDCQQGPQRCEGHHAQPYSQGGQTSISNIHLLCTGTNGHHHQIHDHGRTLQLHDGRWIGPHGFTDPPDRPPG